MGYPYSAQPVLVSGANIKTIGGESVLGSGDIDAVSSADLQAAIAAELAAYTPTSILAAIATSGSASDLIIGTLANARLSPQVVRSDFSYPDPSWVTTLSASKLIGAIDDARLSSNVPLKNSTNTFTATQTIQGANGSIVLQPSGGATIVQGNLLSLDSTSDTLWLRTLVGTSTQKPIELKGNALWLSTNQWHGDQVNSERVYYIGNGTTINKGYGSTPHAWRNASGTQIASLSDAGNATISGNVTANQHTAGILSAAGTTLTGYIEWRKTTGRQGYIGFDAGNNITAQNEAGGYFCFNQPIQIGSGGNTVRNNSGITEVRNSTNSGFSRLRASELQVVGALGGSIATPGNVRIGLMTQDSAYLAGAITGRTYSNNLTYGDVLIGANPTITVGINDYSNIGDDLAIRGNTGNVEINRGNLILASAKSINMSTGANSFSTFMGGPGNYEGWQHFQRNGVTRLFLNDNGIVVQNNIRMIRNGINVAEISDNSNLSTRIRMSGATGQQIDVAGSDTVRLLTNEVARLTIDSVGVVSIPTRVRAGTSPGNEFPIEADGYISSRTSTSAAVGFSSKNSLSQWGAQVSTGGDWEVMQYSPSIFRRLWVTQAGNVNTQDQLTTASAAGNHSMTIRAITSQTGYLLRFADVNNAELAFIGADGSCSFAGGPSSGNGRFRVWGNNGYVSISVGSSAVPSAFQILNAGNWWVGTSQNLGMELRTNNATRITIAANGDASFTNHITSAFQSLLSDPSTLDIPAGLERLVKNTTSGEIRRFVNDGGTIKKSPAYI